MATTDPRGLRGLLPLTLTSVVVVAVALGFSFGVWIPNLHNGLLASTLTTVGAYVLYQRPGHREGLLMMAAGLVEGAMFLGRQVGREPSVEGSRWLGWLGVWPLVIALALTTFAVICFPDGRLPSPRWRVVALTVGTITGVCAVLSAAWPVEYASAGVTTVHPFNIDAPDLVARVWAGIAHPAYVAFQALWVVAILVRWRSSGGLVRRQLAWVGVAAAVSLSTLVLGLALWGTPAPGLIAVLFVPVTAGWTIVHSQHVAAYSALTWLSRAGPEREDLPTDIARAAAEALSARAAILWKGSRAELFAVGVWPESTEDPPPLEVDALHTSPQLQVREVVSHGRTIGALSVERPRTNSLSLAEDRLFADLVAQAALVVEHLSLGELIARQHRAGRLAGLSPREHEILELMARGLTNSAICAELHLSIKTVEPAVSTIFVKLGLHSDANSNRRVLAALAFERHRAAAHSDLRGGLSNRVVASDC